MVTACATVSLSVTVKVAGVVPLSPSSTVTSLVRTSGS